MIGAIAGDIIGSVYEWDNCRSKEFPLFQEKSFFTDDTVLTVALADSILTGEPYVKNLKRYFQKYPGRGYGGGFHRWARGLSDEPYNSYGNGAAMRISPVGFAYATLEETLAKAEEFTAVTHNHPEGIKGAQATAAAIYLARNGSSKDEIRAFIVENYGYHLDRKADDIRLIYQFNETCQETVPEAIIAFLESMDYEDAIRTAISLGGDSDTLACITGGIAEAFYGGVPEAIKKKVYEILDSHLQGVLAKFHTDIINGPKDRDIP